MIPLLLSFGGVRALSPLKLGGDVDTMSSNQNAWVKCRNSFNLPDIVSGRIAWGTREIRHEHATEPSPPCSADGPSASDTPPSGFPAAGLWKAPLDCSFYPRAGGALTTAHPPLSLLLTSHFLPSWHRCFLHLWEFFSSCPVSPSVNGLLYQPVLSHTPPS